MLELIAIGALVIWLIVPFVLFDINGKLGQSLRLQAQIAEDLAALRRKDEKPNGDSGTEP